MARETLTYQISLQSWVCVVRTTSGTLKTRSPVVSQDFDGNQIRRLSNTESSPSGSSSVSELTSE